MLNRNQRSDGGHEMKRTIQKKIEEVFPENSADWKKINNTVHKCMDKSDFVSLENISF